MIFDIICLIVALYLIYGGYNAGFIKESLKLTKYFIVIYIIYKFKELIPNLKNIITNILGYKINEIAMYILIFLLLFIILTIISNILTKLIEIVGLNGVNKILGIIVSAMKSVVIIFILYISFVLITPFSNYVLNTMIESRVADFIENTTSKSIYNMLPQNLKLNYLEYYNKKMEIKAINKVYSEMGAENGKN